MRKLTTICAVLFALAPTAVAAQGIYEKGAVSSEPVITFIEIDRLETRLQSGPEVIEYDAQGYVGWDINKFWWKAEGEFGLSSSDEEHAEFQALYSRAINPFFDLQTGLRQDIGNGFDRTYFVLGLQGLAPQWFEVDTALFLSHKGDVSARTEVEYDLMLSQKLIFQPRLEANLGFSVDAANGLGSGLRDLALEARMKYRAGLKLYPHVGISWHRTYGDTADFRVANGEDKGSVAALVGLSVWF